ncbi:MAG TPA: extracellular solute-binding protein [Ktedonobacteraceae bacterium]|jgi:raffinose/stachyose/melibiose transport system substrate-binding protein|nr:extracellular solute-binding protein [Ktedonobacteraceae bacterium]
MKRRDFLISAAALAAPLALAACGGSNSGGNGKVTVNWWHINGTDPLKSTWQNIANQYMKAHPNVTIKITIIPGAALVFQQKLQTAMEAGTPPDMFQSWGGGNLEDYVKADQIQDITTYLQQSGWGDTFGKGPLSLYVINGRNYGVPWDAGAVGFWYDPDLFSQAGIQQPPATWADLLSSIDKLKAKNITPIALGEGDKWPGAFYWEYLAVRRGGQSAFQNAYSRKGSFADKPFVEAGQYLQQLLALKPFQNGSLGATYASEQQLMGNGKAAMELMGQWGPTNDAASAATPGSNPKLGFFPFPSVPGGLGAATDVLGGGNGFAFSKKASPEALDFARFVTNATNQRGLAKQNALVPPVTTAVDGLVDPEMQKVQKLVANATYYQLYYDQFFSATVGNGLNDQVQTLFAGTKTPAQMAQAFDAVVAANLKQ